MIVSFVKKFTFSDSFADWPRTGRRREKQGGHHARHEERQNPPQPLSRAVIATSTCSGYLRSSPTGKAGRTRLIARSAGACQTLRPAPRRAMIVRDPTRRRPHGTDHDSLEINRPPEEVFAYIDDLARHKEWQDQIVSAKVNTDGPTKVGTTVTETRRFGKREMTQTWEVTEHDPPRTFAFRRDRRPRPGRRERIGGGGRRGTLARQHLPRLRGPRAGEADGAGGAQPGAQAGVEGSGAAQGAARGRRRNEQRGSRVRASVLVPSAGPGEPEPARAGVLDSGSERQRQPLRAGLQATVPGRERAAVKVAQRDDEPGHPDARTVNVTTGCFPPSCTARRPETVRVTAAGGRAGLGFPVWTGAASAAPDRFLSPAAATTAAVRPRHRPPPPAAPAGTTAFDGAEAGPVPAALVAVTVKVYAVPFVRPPTVIGLFVAGRRGAAGRAVTV